MKNEKSPTSRDFALSEVDDSRFVLIDDENNQNKIGSN